MSKEFICKGCGEKFNKDMQSSNVDYCYICNEFYMKKYVADLEAKLAEKEKEIEILKLQTKEYLEKGMIIVRYEDLRAIDEKANQDKISFAVEQLEKVKEFFLEEHRDEEMDTDYIITKDAGEIADYLLDQIKQLKEGN